MVLASVSYGQELPYLYCERSPGLYSLDVGQIMVLSISEEKHDSILLCKVVAELASSIMMNI